MKAETRRFGKLQLETVGQNPEHKNLEGGEKAEGFYHTPVIEEARILVYSLCKNCAASKVVSSHDGSLAQWENGHVCENLNSKHQYHDLNEGHEQTLVEINLFAEAQANVGDSEHPPAKAYGIEGNVSNEFNAPQTNNERPKAA